MGEKKSGLKKLFSKSSSKDCCNIEIEEVKANEDGCCDETDKNLERQKEA